MKKSIFALIIGIMILFAGCAKTGGAADAKSADISLEKEASENKVVSGQDENASELNGNTDGSTNEISDILSEVSDSGYVDEAEDKAGNGSFNIAGNSKDTMNGAAEGTDDISEKRIDAENILLDNPLTDELRSVFGIEKKSQDGGSGDSFVHAETKPVFEYTKEDMETFIPHYELRYFLHGLDDEMAENFLALYLAVSKYENVCILPHDIHGDEMEVLQYLLSLECPELLHFQDAEMELVEVKRSELVIYQEMHINYLISKEDSEAQYIQCKSTAEAIKETAFNETDCSDEALEKFAYDYLTERINYNIDAKYSGNAYGALIENQAKCDGISLAMKWVCEEMGIPCMIIAGQENGDPVGHAWNMIEIDGVFYDLDLTNDVRGEGKPPFNMYLAYNVSRTWIRDNFPIKEVYANNFVMPGTVSMEGSYHVKNNEFFKTGESCWQHYCDALDDALANNKSVILLQFEAESDFNGFVSSVSDMHEDWVYARGTGIKCNIFRNNRYKTVAVEVDFN